MATITPTTDNGLDLIKKLSQGTFIDTFDLNGGNIELPEMSDGVVMPWGSDLLNTLNVIGGISYDDMASDRLDWLSTGRLNQSYKATVTRSGDVLTFPAGHDIRVGDVIEIAGASARSVANVKSIAGNDVTVAWKQATPIADTTGLSVIHSSREVKKGSDGTTDFLTREYQRHTNNPVIIRDGIRYTRSDMAQKVQFLEGNDALWTIDYSDVETRHQNAQTMAVLYGAKTESGSDAKTEGLEGMTSLESFISASGNNISGSIDSMADIEGLIRMYTANKTGMNNMLLLSLDYVQKLDAALGKVNQYDSGAYNFGTFDNSKAMINLGFEGFDKNGFKIAYKPLDVLDDQMYYGAFAADNKPQGFSIPVGSTPDGMGGRIPYMSIVYRSNARRNVIKDGAVFGHGLSDSAQIDIISELTLRVASTKDFSSFS